MAFANFIRILLIGVFLLASQFLFSQKEEIQFEHLSMKDGLSMNPVMAITQDKKGFLWFGTQDGLNRYDGYKFKIFKTKDEDTLSISDNFVTALANDTTGNLWIGTLSGGLNMYDTKKGSFLRVGKEIGLADNSRIWCLLLDDQNFLWIGTDKGYTIIDPLTKHVINPNGIFPGLRNYLNENPILTVFREKNGDVWMGTTAGAIHYSVSEKKCSPYFSTKNENSLSSNIVVSFHQDKNNNVWAGTIDGLNKFDKKTGTFARVYFKNRLTSSGDNESKESTIKNIYSIINNYGGNTIRAILEDAKGNFWIGTDMELIIYNPFNGEYVNYKKDLVNPTGITDHFIRSMYVDHSGNLWIGTLGNGINKTSLHPKKFAHYQKKINDPNSLSENYVRAICEDEEGSIWVGTLVGGLNKFDPFKEKFFHYSDCKTGTKNCMNDNNVWSLCLDVNKKIWVGTNNGLNLFDRNTNTYKYFTHVDKDPSSISENTIRSLFRDSKGRLWIGTEGGLNQFNYSNEKFKTYRAAENKDSLSNNTIWKITEGPDKTLWLATNNGLNNLDQATGKFKRFFKRKGDSTSLSHNSVRAVFIDSKGVLWVGTQNGLNRFNNATQSFTRYDESNGLPNAFIYAIQEDDHENLWLSTNKGLCSFTPATGKIKSYDVYDGLQDLEFNTNASCRAKNGEMYFAGPAGMNRFNPEKLNADPFNPEIQITSVNIQGKSYLSGLDVTDIDEIKLNYDQNILMFEFSSFDFSRPDRNRYQYKMEGFNREWVDAGNVNFITYTNLDPGEYTFRVKGTNSDGVWSKYSDSMKVIVFPPFWKTTWFYILITALLMFSVYLFYRLRLAKVNREKNILAQKVKDRTQDLEEEKQKLEQVNAELEKLSIVVSKTENAVVIASPEGIIEWTNLGFAKMRSKKIADKKNINGKSIYDFSTNPDLKDAVDQSIAKRVAVNYESESTNDEGRNFWVQSSLTPIYDEGGKVSKLIIIDADITERKHAEEIITEKNKNITDSINYAVRIQKALLPNDQKINTLFPESFVFFKPKDIVSGDFYFYESIKMNDGTFLKGFAVGDCTGHGVPGAFMSMIGTSFLKQSLTDKNVNSPAEALNFLSKKINDTLSYGAGDNLVKDGMDIAFCVFNTATSELYFSGANRPCLIVGKNGLIEIRGDKRPVGYSENDTPFTNKTCKLEKGDCVYLFSDGYADQFGGPKGKKFKYKKLQELILSIKDLPMHEQKNKIEKSFNDWISSPNPHDPSEAYEQIDDVCIIGIRV